MRLCHRNVYNDNSRTSFPETKYQVESLVINKEHSHNPLWYNEQLTPIPCGIITMNTASIVCGIMNNEHSLNPLLYHEQTHASTVLCGIMNNEHSQSLLV